MIALVVYISSFFVSIFDIVNFLRGFSLFGFQHKSMYSYTILFFIVTYNILTKKYNYWFIIFKHHYYYIEVKKKRKRIT